MNTYNLSIYQGETFETTLVAYSGDGVSPRNLSGSLVSGYVKTRYGDSGILVNLNAQITGAANGQVYLSIPATGTAALPINYAFYDVEALFTATSVVTKLFGGRVSVYPEVTV